MRVGGEGLACALPARPREHPAASRTPATPEPGPDGLCFRRIHGYQRAFIHVGSGPALLLIHGIGDHADTWRDLIPELAKDYTVIAPDLLGHGRSDKPRADYAVAAYANAMRDLLSVLGIDRATVVGHSLGGGVAMQFAYQWLGTDIGRDAKDVQRIFDALPDAPARRAFVRTLRGVIDWHGQVITMLDRCYLTCGMPTLLVWGEHDAVVPYDHAARARAAMPGSRLEVFADAGHFPHHQDPARFLAVLRDFLMSMDPASYSVEEWRQILRRGRPGVSSDDAQPSQAA